MRFNYFYKMAMRNIQANRQLYFPYAISAVLTIAMFLQMMTLVGNDFGLVRGGTTVDLLLRFGVIIIGMFSLVFLLYANSFLIKRRKKEIGLYGILGLEKKHVSKILFVETSIIGIVSIGFGLLIGTIFGRLFFLLLNYLLQLPRDMEYQFQPLNLLLTAMLFAGIFLLAYFYNLSQVTFANPITLLKGEKEGEREPKSNIVMFLLGLVSLGAGYWISLTIADPVAALTQFFLAVLLVIVGTYFLFTSGSIFILKMMKKNKKLYYQPRAFISISGMLYRMKQNATGLANIAILSCMVIIALGTTIAIYAGAEASIADRYPAENNATVYYQEEISVPAIEEDMEIAIDHLVAERGSLEVTDFISYPYANIFGRVEGNSVQGNADYSDSMKTIYMLSVDDFNELEEDDLQVGENEIYIHETANYGHDTIDLGGIEFAAKEFDSPVSSFSLEESYGRMVLIVLPNREAMNQVLQGYQDGGYPSVSVTGTIRWNTTGTEEEKQAYAERLRPVYETDDVIVRYETKVEGSKEWYTMNGGLLFLGIFLGMLFILGTILITYFKQISEGYEDRSRFNIMQKVGLSKEMIRSTSRSQVVWMFMLPLLVATLHTAFAYPILRKLLFIFGLKSQFILLSSIGGVVIAFSLLYWLIYRLTAKVYYSIVQ